MEIFSFFSSHNSHKIAGAPLSVFPHFLCRLTSPAIKNLTLSLSAKQTSRQPQAFTKKGKTRLRPPASSSFSQPPCSTAALVSTAKEAEQTTPAAPTYSLPIDRSLRPSPFNHGTPPPTSERTDPTQPHAGQRLESSPTRQTQL